MNCTQVDLPGPKKSVLSVPFHFRWLFTSASMLSADTVVSGSLRGWDYGSRLFLTAVGCKARSFILCEAGAENLALFILHGTAILGCFQFTCYQELWINCANVPTQ